MKAGHLAQAAEAEVLLIPNQTSGQFKIADPRILQPEDAKFLVALVQGHES